MRVAAHGGLDEAPARRRMPGAALCLCFVAPGLARGTLSVCVARLCRTWCLTFVPALMSVPVRRVALCMQRVALCFWLQCCCAALAVKLTLSFSHLSPNIYLGSQERVSALCLQRSAQPRVAFVQAVAGAAGDISVISVVEARVVCLLKGGARGLPHSAPRLEG